MLKLMVYGLIWHSTVYQSLLEKSPGSQLPSGDPLWFEEDLRWCKGVLSLGH